MHTRSLRAISAVDSTEHTANTPGASAMPLPQREGLDPILVVDDDTMMRTAIVDMLREAKYVAVSAGSAEEAEGRLSQRLWMAFLDVTLPGAQGDKLCRKLRLKPETWDLPIVMVTASEDNAV